MSTTYHGPGEHSHAVAETPVASYYDFTLVRRLGEGGQAAVYLAKYAPTGEQIALKVAKSDEEVRRIREEGATLAQLSHPGIVPVLYRSKPDSVHGFIAMPVEKDLSGLSPAERKIALARLAEALDYVHGEGLLHRDIKVSNFFLSDEGDAMLGDFGRACRQGLVQEKFYGYPPYTAPEVLAKQDHTPASDIYSFGVAAHKLLFGAYPVLSGSGIAAFDRCLSRNPAERFESATEFMYALSNDPNFSRLYSV